MAEDPEARVPSAEALEAAIRLIAQLQHEPVDPTDADIVPTACALDAFAARAVAAERERCLRIIREEIAAARVGSVRGSIASIADAIWRGER